APPARPQPRLWCETHSMISPTEPPLIGETGNRRTYSAAFFVLTRDELIRSFMILLALKTSTRLGVIGTTSPVFGLRPTRSLLSRTPNDPKLESLTFSPCSRQVITSRITVSTNSADSLRGSPTF